MNILAALVGLKLKLGLRPLAEHWFFATLCLVMGKVNVKSAGQEETKAALHVCTCLFELFVMFHSLKRGDSGTELQH